MISSLFLIICFLVLLTKKDKGIRLMSLLCMGHIAIENAMFAFFCHRPELFDLSLYLSLCWSLDTALLFGVACVLTGLQKKLTAALAIPFLLCQVFFVQYPSLFPDLLSFSLSSSYLNFMETFIFVCSLKDTSVKEWLKTSIIIFCIIALQLMG